MATKTFQTRIQSKYDTYANWTEKNPVLLSGEIAIATVPQKDENGFPTGVPALLVKVGDGEKGYNALPFISALAADVHDWAKAAEKPEYKASEITGLSDYISGEIQDTNTQYQLVKVDDYTYKMQSKEVNGEWADMTPQIVIPKYDDTALANRVSALEGKVDVAKVSEAISAAITELNIAQYATKTEAQGYANAVQSELTSFKTTTNAAFEAIKDGESIDSFADVEAALAGKQATGDYALKSDAQGYATTAKTEAIAAAVGAEGDAATANTIWGAKAYADSKNGAIEAAQSKANEAAGAAATAQTAAEGAQSTANQALAAANTAQGEVDAVESDLAGFKTTVSSTYETKNDASQKLQDAKDYTDEKIALLMDNSSEAVDSIVELAQAMKDNADAIDALEDIAGGKVAQGDFDAAVARIGALETADGEQDGKISALETAVGKKADQTTVDGIEGRLATAEGEIDALQATAAGLGTLATKNEVAKSDLASALQTEIDAKATEADLTLAEGRIAALEGVGAQANVIEKVTAGGTEVAISDKTVALSKVAESGKIEDLTQVDLIIFNCGSASVNI